MAKLHDLLAERARAEIQIGSSTLAFQYWVLWRERFTDEEWQQLLALRGRDYLKMLLPRTLISWDLVGDDGAAIPITADAFDQLDIPDAILAAFDRRIFNSDLAGKVLTPSS